MLTHYLSDSAKILGCPAKVLVLSMLFIYKSNSPSINPSYLCLWSWICIQTPYLRLEWWSWAPYKARD